MADKAESAILRAQHTSVLFTMNVRADNREAKFGVEIVG